MQTQPTNNPDVVAALERVLAGRKSQADEMEAARVRAQREAQAPRITTIAPPAPERASDFVCVQLAYAKDNPASVKSLGDVYLTDDATGDAVKVDLVAGLPHFVEKRFVASGWTQRECQKLEAAGLLTLQAPGRDGSFHLDDCKVYGKAIGLIAVGFTPGKLDMPKPRVTEAELLRAAALVAPGAPELAEALLKLAKGSQVTLATFLEPNASGAMVQRRVGFDELR